MAAAHAAAAAKKLPLWRYLSNNNATVLPLPEIQIFGGGAHAGRRTDIQDFMIMAPKAQSFAQALQWTAEVYHAAGRLLDKRGLLAGVADEGGYWPAFDGNADALDVLVGAIGGWLDRYPIASVEDPLSEDDDEGLKRFTESYGERIQIVGDDYLVTDAERVERAAAGKTCNAVLLKPNQRGTLTETLAAFNTAKEARFGAIVSARSGESEDVTIAHLAVGWGVAQLKVGSFSRSERMAKWNECLRIEEALGETAKFAGAAPLKGTYGLG